MGLSRITGRLFVSVSLSLCQTKADPLGSLGSTLVPLVCTPFVLYATYGTQ